MILDLTFAGQLPYQRRLQLLDLASWRVLNRAVDLRDDLLQRELLSAEALATLIQGRARANQLLSESDDADPFDFEYAARRFSRVWPGDFVPVLVSHRINIARLTNDERFGLPASVLAVAATEMTPWTLQSVQSTNPLTAKVVFAATLGILVGAAVLWDNHKAEQGAEHMRKVCEAISDHYAEDLKKAKVNPKHLDELGEAFKGCLESPLFETTPIKAELALPTK